MYTHQKNIFSKTCILTVLIQSQGLIRTYILTVLIQKQNLIQMKLIFNYIKKTPNFLG